MVAPAEAPPRSAEFGVPPGATTAVWKRPADFLELTKPGITALVLVTAGVGFYLASVGAPDLLVLSHTLLGTALLAGGTNALNQYAEREVDARMLRTCRRPIPAGRMAPGWALAFATGISVLGAVHLWLTVNALTALLGVTALVAYVFVYTPLKRRTPLCTVVGAVPGAIPPLMGWAAVTGEIGLAAWVLFGIVFLWQLPHFFAIALLCRADYARAGFPMLPVLDPGGAETGRQIMLYTVALIPVSLLTTALDVTGRLYLVGALALGIAFLLLAVAVAVYRSSVSARRLFLASVVYLPAILALMVVDKV